jgi:hypothetical protein
MTSAAKLSEKREGAMRFEALNTVIMKTVVFWDVT